MTDDERLADPLGALDRLPAGSAVIVRRREPGAREATARAILPECRRRGMRVLIADDADLARRLGADGVHLPEAAVKRRPRRPFPDEPGWLVTAAAHSGAALARAAGAGVDAVLLSPVFATQSHPGDRVLGPLRFRALCRDAAVPVYALGGIDTAGLRRLRGSGAAGIAGIGIAGG
ncbi:MAG: thiamine phosphate synthase [Rhodospirillales bacterium]